MIEDDGLLKKYTNIWYKVNANITKEFDSEPVDNKIFLKTKIKSYDDEATDFYSNHSSLVVILINSVFKKDENYYPQVFLKECKYNEKDWTDILVIT